MALTVEAALTCRQFDMPDETRLFLDDMGRAEMIEIGGRMVARTTCEPGWRWSDHLRPIAQTKSCKSLHLGTCIAGEMRIIMDDGEQMEIRAGDVFEIPPGHDAEVIGSEACVILDFGDIAEYAKPFDD
ncbi:MAG: cupin domain-containing protein [Solirubrobacterales bacterium]